MRRAASGPDGGDSGAAEARRQPAAFEAVADAACRRAEQLVQQMMRLHDDSLEPDYDSGRAPFLAPGGLDLARAKAANRALRGVVGAAASALATSRAALLGARADLDAASVSACAAQVAFAVPRCSPTFGRLHATLSLCPPRTVSASRAATGLPAARRVASSLFGPARVVACSELGRRASPAGSRRRSVSSMLRPVATKTTVTRRLSQTDSSSSSNNNSRSSATNGLGGLSSQSSCPVTKQRTACACSRPWQPPRSGPAAQRPRQRPLAQRPQPAPSMPGRSLQRLAELTAKPLPQLRRQQERPRQLQGRARRRQQRAQPPPATGPWSCLRQSSLTGWQRWRLRLLRPQRATLQSCRCCAGV